MTGIHYSYFKIQFRRCKRTIIETGIPLLIAYPIFIALFFLVFHLLSLYPFWASCIISLSNIQILFNLSDYDRNNFLKSIYHEKDYYRIRIVENLLVSSVSIILLSITENYWHTALIILACILFLFTTTIRFWKTSLPTPFTKKPFEFILGFRRTWLLILVIYLLGSIGLLYGNENLGLFCVFCISICCSFYYQDPENIYFYWSNNRKPVTFLIYKIKRGILQLSILILPLIILFLILFPSSYLKIILVWFLVTLLIPTVICIKYAVYPRKISITEGLMLSLCLSFYPLVLALIPYYISKAIKNLRNL